MSGQTAHPHVSGVYLYSRAGGTDVHLVSPNRWFQQLFFDLEGLFVAALPGVLEQTAVVL